MKQLSFWARDNKVATRILICFIYLLLNILGLFSGDLLYSMNIELSSLFFYTALAVGLFGLCYYPSRQRKNSYKNFYVRQKVADFLLGIATFLFVVFTGNSLNKNKIAFNNPVYGISIIKNNSAPDNSVVKTKKNNAKSKSFSKKSLKKYIRSVVKNARAKYQSADKSHKTLYIILAVIGALLLLTALAGLTCSIVCSGAEVLGYIVLFVGIGAIIFGFIKLVQRISRGKPKAAPVTP